MTHEKLNLRPGFAALAAVIALSSTPLLAQSVDSGAAAPTAPVEIAPPPPAVTAPAPAPTPAPPVATSSAPVVHTPDATATTDTTTTTAAPSRAAPRRAAKPAPVTTTATAARATESSKSTVTPTPNPAALVPPLPVAPMAAVPTPVPPPVKAAPQPAPAATAQNDEMIELAAAGGLGLLVIAGGAFYLMRRRRHDEDVYDSVELEGATTAAQPEPAPAFFAAPPMAPAPVADPAEAELPKGFDISQFGRHVQAAYRGPTPDNPSLSLKTRLKRARFFDQRERMAASERRPSEARRGNPFMLHLEHEQASANSEPVFQG